MNWLVLIWIGVNAASLPNLRGTAEVNREIPVVAITATPSDLTTSSLWSDPAVNLLSDFGPLSPLAMSPFFGITVLSGLSQLENTQWGGAFLADYTMVARNPVLKHPATFWVFLVLTILTSLPRMTKVSKPVAQALDWVESYSVL
ncbi:MAG: hypothetical protein JNK57_13205, partial [Planctomycetaceae bacterium]|nr:hypothetical protein [Planctomycetaceae bacterium]